MAQDSCAVFLEVRLGLRQRQKRGRSLSTRGSFLAPLRTLSGFQRAGAQEATSDCGSLRTITSRGVVFERGLPAETETSLTDFKSL